MEVSHRPDCEGPDNHKTCLFIPSHQRNAMAECQTTAATLELGRGGAQS